jgi:hypothetical protein
MLCRQAAKDSSTVARKDLIGRQVALRDGIRRVHHIGSRSEYLISGWIVAIPLTWGCLLHGCGTACGANNRQRAAPGIKMLLKEAWCGM